MDTTARDLFEKLKGRSKNLTLGREDGTRTLIPNEASFFEFDYHNDENKLGSVVVSLVDEGSLKVYFATNIMDDANSESKDGWYGFLKGLRKFSTQNMLNYEAKNISKERLDKRDFEYLSKQNKTEEELTMESKLYGSRQKSYQDLNGAKLIVQHTKTVDEDKMGSRSRNIRAVYIENSDGERFKFENNYLPGARAMARHVSNGGYPRDEFGAHISEIMAEMTELRSFVRGVKGKEDYVTEDAQDIIEKATGRYYGLKSTLESVSKQRGYTDYFENYEPTDFEVSEDDINDLKQKLTREVFDSRLEGSLGAVGKAMKHSTQLQEKKSGDFYDWDDWSRSAKQNGAEIKGDISGAVAIVNGKEIGEWNQDDADVTGDKIASRFKKPGYGELNVDDGDRSDSAEREFTVPDSLELRPGGTPISSMQYASKEDLLNLLMVDVASRAMDDEVANFAAKMADKVGSVGTPFGQDANDSDFKADKKKAVALANMYIKQMSKKDESVETEELPRKRPEDPFEAYAESMDSIAEYDEYSAMDSFTNNLNLSPEEDAMIASNQYEDNEELMAKLMDHFSDAMPYGTQKGRDGDPYEFIFQELDNMGLIKEDNVDEGSFNKDGSYNTSDDEANEFDDEDDDSEDDKDAKPDFLDLDGDGDKEESMKKAVKDKKKVEEAQGETIHAWWETQKGPGDMEGQVLRYFKKNENYDPNAVGLRNGPYFTPSLDWWPSVEDFEQGKQGFSNKTKADAEGWEIHDRKSDALAKVKIDGKEEVDEAAKPDFLDLDKDGNKKESMKKAAKDKEDKKEVKEGTWHIADDMSGLQELIASGPILAKDALDVVSEYIGDDDLSDAIGELEEKDPNADARDVIRDFLEQGDMDTYEEVQTVEEEDDMAWLRKAAGIGSGARSNHGIREGEQGYQTTPRSLVAREMRKLQDIAIKD